MTSKVLVIEEQSSIRNEFLQGLRNRGFEAIEAENGRRGIQYAHEYRPHIITCGINIAEMDGFTVLKTLRQNAATAIIPFIFITVKMARSDLHKAMELGVSAYLTKPCTIDELVQTITAQLERQSLLHQCYSTQSRSLPPASPPLPSLQRSSALPHPAESYASPLNEALHFIATNYHRAIALSDVAQVVGYSPAYLTHLMGRQTGQTVQQWIIQYRMTAACTLLLETNQPVEQIATQVGYHHTVHFFRQFRRIYGTTPQAWRNHHRQSSINSLHSIAQA